MARPHGSRNRKIGRADITKVSLQVIQESIDVVITKIKLNELTDEEKVEMLHLLQKMEAVLRDGKEWLDRPYRW